MSLNDNRNDGNSAPASSSEVLPDSLQVHETLPTSTGIKWSQFEEVQPLQNIGRQGSITFNITTDKDHFLDPYSTFVYIESILKKADGDNLATGDAADGDVAAESKVITINGLSHAWFNNVIVKINGTVIESVNNKYAYRGDLETRLSYPKEIKMGHLKLSGFDEEIAAFEDVVLADLQFANVILNRAITKNHAFARRFNTCCNSKVIRTIGRIHSTIFEQPKALPPHTHLEVTFERNKEDFLLLTKQPNPSYWLQMQRMLLFVRKMELRESLALDIEQVASAGKNYLYPVRRVKMATYQKGPNVEDFSQTDILPGEEELPRRIFVVLVRHESVQGNYARDPFNYQAFGVKKVGLRIAGQEKPYPFFECNLAGDNPNLTMPLWGLLQSCQSFCGEHELGIGPDNYMHRNCIFGWDLTTTQLPYGMCYETSGRFTIDLIMLMNDMLAYVVDIIVYAEYDAEIELSASRKVKFHENA